MIEPFRHNSWATVRLLDFCRNVDPALLDASSPGTYGSVKDTLAHIVGREEVLIGAVEGASWQGPPPAYASLDDLIERARRLSERWERCFEQEPHPDRLVEAENGGTRLLVRVGTILAHVVHHGNHHRSQVCTVLGTVAIEVPPLDGWAYGAWLADRGDRQRRRDDAL